MDIKKLAEELIAKVQKDPKLLEQLQKDPVKTAEKLLGVDLPDAEVNKLIDLVKGKIALDKAGSLLNGLGGLLKK